MFDPAGVVVGDLSATGLAGMTAAACAVTRSPPGVLDGLGHFDMEGERLIPVAEDVANAFAPGGGMMS
jgi:hypothetical protein